MWLFLVGFILAGQDEGWHVDETDLDVLSAVHHMVVLPDDSLFLLSTTDRALIKLNASGKMVAQYIRSGEGPGEFQAPFKLHYLADRQQLVIADGRKRKRMFFTSSGQFLFEQPLSSRHMQALLLADNRLAYSNVTLRPEKPRQGADVFLSDGSSHDTVLFHLGPERHADAQSIPGMGNNYIRFPWDPKLLMAASPDGMRLYLGSTADLDVAVFNTTDHSLVGHIRGRLPKPTLTNEEVDAYLQGLKREFRRVYRSDHFSNLKYKSPIISMHVDRLSRLWLRLQTKAQDRSARWQVYSPEGKLAGSLELPLTFKWGFANAAFLWGRDVDESEGFVVLKQPYRLTP